MDSFCYEHLTEPAEPESPALEAERLVNGPRQGDYGHPFDDFSKTALIWQAILGIPITPEQVALCMVGVKISRQVNKPKRDNITDGIGYWLTLDLVEKERARREGLSGVEVAGPEGGDPEHPVPADPRPRPILSGIPRRVGE